MLPNHLGFIRCVVTYLLHLVYPDNISTTYLVVNPINHARTKHLKVALHFVHDQVASRDIEVKFVSSSDHVADILTMWPIFSPIFGSLLLHLLCQFELSRISSSNWGGG